ncbi:hypothetical protein Q3G72_012491 [Acer saccharum]|nr:hypothetical protein Q3G72_012491 [Acer saccharum]
MGTPHLPFLGFFVLEINIYSSRVRLRSNLSDMHIRWKEKRDRAHKRNVVDEERPPRREEKTAHAEETTPEREPPSIRVRRSPVDIVEI